MNTFDPAKVVLFGSISDGTGGPDSDIDPLVGLDNAPIADRRPLTVEVRRDRAPGYNLIIISQWTEPAQTDDCIAWARQTYDSLRPHMADSAYVNYLDIDDGNRVRAAYGPNYDRLRELKRRYDPDNLFHLNQNIPPS